MSPLQTRIQYYITPYKRQLLWGLAAFVVLAGVYGLYVGWNAYQKALSAIQPLTEEEKLDILAGVSKSSTTTMPVSERHDILESVSASSDVEAAASPQSQRTVSPEPSENMTEEEAEKLRILQSI